MFLSGSTHVVLELGQPMLDDGPTAAFLQATAPDAMPAVQPAASQEGKRKLNVSVRPSNSNTSNGPATTSPGSTKTGGSKSGPSLLDLLEAGMLQPGGDNMRVTYKGNTYSGALQANGTILFNGNTFNTPSAFSVHVKRILTPNKQGDDGWHSVYVDGVLLLNAVRQQYQAKMLGQPVTQPNKTPRRSQSSPRGSQQQQPAPQQQQPQAVQQQQPGQQPGQQLGLRPPLPTPKLKLGNIKGVPQQQQQGLAGNGVLQPAAPGEQTQQQQPKQKLKFKMSLKKGGGAAAAGVAAPEQQQQQLGAGAGEPCPFNPSLPVHEQQPQQHAVAAQELGPPDWVRCCRCEQWRGVPEGCYAQVAAVGANWFCEDAHWDVKRQQPFTAACMPDVWGDTPDDDGLMVPAA